MLVLQETLLPAEALLPSPSLVRAIAVFAPIAAVLLLAAVRGLPPLRLAAALLATAWSAAVLYPLNLAAIHLGWWRFSAEGAVADGVPVDLWLGWALLWGAVPALLPLRVPAPVVVAAAAWTDLALMPWGASVVHLGEHWVPAIGLALALCLVPSLLLARATERGTAPTARVWAQIVLAGAFMLALPLHLLDLAVPWPPPAAGFPLQAAALAVLPGVAAAREFAAAGGTPLPFDPPRRLVTGGPYAYVRNPMQLSVVLAFLAAAAVAADPRPLLGAVIAAAYGAGLASWHEGEQLRAAHGRAWNVYRQGVRVWLPRWRPWPGRPAARLFAAGDCATCHQVGEWFALRGPVALVVLPAARHPGHLRRITYEADDGIRAYGIAAVARAMEHLNLGWALAGWALALPGVRHLVQMCTDALGPALPLPEGPRA